MYNLIKNPIQPHQEEIKPKLKINNSYESEPSSGSGSSISENNDCNVSDEENMRLPFMLKLPLQQQDVIMEVKTAKLPAMPSINSSQESPFHGFTDSPFGKIKQKIFNGTPKERTLPTQTQTKSGEKLNSSQDSSFHGFASSPEERLCKQAEPSPGKAVFPNFYDVWLENSSNAVDILLPQATTVVESPKHLDLSFNGKIKNINAAASNELRDDIKTDMFLNSSQALSESSFNRKHCSSPDLFGDDEDDEETNNEKQTNAVGDAVSMLPLSLQSTTNTKPLNLEKLLQWNRRCEREMLRRTRKCLSGLPPPPSMTILQMNLFEEITNKKTAILNFFNEIQRKDEKSGIKTDDLSNSPNCSREESTQTRICLLKPTHSLEETKSMKWKDVLAVRQHGLSYNLNKASEDNDQLSLSVVERFVGAETASSYRGTPSSEQKRQSRLKLLTQSPGSRLSHLARRRSVFSSANLASNSQKSLGPQILVDRVKVKGRRRGSGTPNSKKKRKTPTSARKSLYRCDLKKPGPTRETSKRALFQSPAKQTLKMTTISRPLQIKPEIATRLEKSKRALFSPDKTQNPNSLDNLLKRKRANVDTLAEDDDNSLIQNNKLFRGGNEVITPRTLKIKSQSFCIGAQSTHAIVSETVAFASNQLNLQMMKGQKTQNTPNMLQRAQSELTVQSFSLTENQRKKLLWAVSQALQEKKISTKHAKFRDFAAALARIVRRLFQEFYQKSSTSNSETMLKLSKKYAFQVISGRQADDIYMEAKQEIVEKARLSRARFSGYIGPEEYEQRKLDLEARKTCSLQNLYNGENSMDICWSGTSQSQMSQSSMLPLCSQENEKAIQPNPALQNSTSKNNLGLVLRENALDGNEQRRSAQKSSATKEGNLSARKSVSKLLSSPNVSHFNANFAKAKRNINFE